MDRIAVIGKGKVGRSLAAAIMFHGSDRLVANLAARTQLRLKTNADILFIATRDDAIAETAEKALSALKTQPRIIVHLAGSQPSTILPERKGLARLTLHPIQTFPQPNRDGFNGIVWMASSEESIALAWAQRFVRSIGSSRTIVLSADQLPLYHAMTVFGANFVTMLVACVEEIAEKLGSDRKRIKPALEPLIRASLNNALAEPAADVLTGPIKRRDMATIKAHQAALQKADPNLRKIYDAFLNYGLGM